MTGGPSRRIPKQLARLTPEYPSLRRAMARYIYVVGILRATEDVWRALLMEAENGRRGSNLLIEGARTYFFESSRQDAGRIASTLAKMFAPGRVWIESSRDTASSRPLAVDVRRELVLTRDELELRAKLPVLDEQVWFELASHVQVRLVQAHADGAVTDREAMRRMRRCSINCPQAERERLLLLTALQMLRQTPAARRGKRPRHPEWVRRSLVGLLRTLRVRRSEESFSPHFWNDYKPHMLTEAIEMAVNLGLLDESIRETTLFDWYREFPDEGAEYPPEGDTSVPPGEG